jgi:assimilatory nitrate reductase catalytic subunit
MTMDVLQTDDARPTQVTLRGDDAFPVNRGQMCIKGFNAAPLLTHAERLSAPRVRRANGAWEDTTWEEALDLVAERMLALREKHGPASLAAFGSGALTNETAYALGKFARLAMKTPNIDYNGRYCMSSAAAGQNRAFGIDRGLPFPVADIAETGALLLWGANPAETLPPIMQWIVEQRERGGKLIVVDPRVTETAKDADLHLQLTLGTDLALANGLLYLAIEEGLVDEAFVRERTTGFDDVRRSVSDYYPARVERRTGVSVERMRRAVRLLAKSASSMLLSGRGPEQQSKGADTVTAFINLMLALGKVGKPHSGYGCLTGQGNGQGGREHGQKADQLPGYRLIENAADRAAVARAWGVDPAELPGKGKSAYELLDSLGAEGGIRSLIVFGSNVVVASPDANRIAARLRSLDLLVVADAFANETSEYAHVVLPVRQWAEEEGTMTNLEGRVIRRRRAVRPPRGVRGDLDVIVGLAERLAAGEHFRFRTPQQVFDELRLVTHGAKADYSGITYDKIDREQGVFWPCPEPDHPGTPRLFAESFYHADKKARFLVVHDRPSGEEPDEAYPFYFTTGRYKEHYNSGAQTRRVDRLSDEKPEPRLEMHPRAAQRLGIVDGDRVVVESRRGRVDFRVLVSAATRPDTLFAPFHWGGKVAANALTQAALDPTSRMPEFKICAVRVHAAKDDSASDAPRDSSADGA